MNKLVPFTLALAVLTGNTMSYATAQTSPSPHSPDTNTKPMASDPAFEVVTIKPSNPDHPYNTPPFGHHVAFAGTTVRFLLAFAYDVHDKQIIGAPNWMASEKFDFDGISDTPGTPNLKQIQTMLQKLLTDRLQLKFHKEKRELSTYILTVTKNGPRLTHSPDDPNGFHSLLGWPQRGMKGHNLTMTDFASRLQSGILDRPVVDQTNLQGKYDFSLKWTPDETQFTQVGIRVQPPTNSSDAPPGLFTAIQEQLGLKLSPAKASVDVLVIDHIEKPSEN